MNAAISRKSVLARADRRTRYLFMKAHDLFQLANHHLRVVYVSGLDITPALENSLQKPQALEASLVLRCVFQDGRRSAAAGDQYGPSGFPQGRDKLGNRRSLHASTVPHDIDAGAT